MILRRRLKFAASREEAQADNLAAFVSRANLLRLHPHFPNLGRDTLGASTDVIGSGPQPAKIVAETLSQLLASDAFTGPQQPGAVKALNEALKASTNP